MTGEIPGKLFLEDLADESKLEELESQLSGEYPQLDLEGIRLEVF